MKEVDHGNARKSTLSDYILTFKNDKAQKHWAFFFYKIDRSNLYILQGVVNKLLTEGYECLDAWIKLTSLAMF